MKLLHSQSANRCTYASFGVRLDDGDQCGDDHPLLGEPSPAGPDTATGVARGFGPLPHLRRCHLCRCCAPASLFTRLRDGPSIRTGCIGFLYTPSFKNSCWTRQQLANTDLSRTSPSSQCLLLELCLDDVTSGPGVRSHILHVDPVHVCVLVVPHQWVGACQKQACVLTKRGFLPASRAMADFSGTWCFKYRVEGCEAGLRRHQGGPCC